MMRTVLGRMMEALAPLRCSGCDEGTGTVYDPRAGRLAPCGVCHGTGHVAPEEIVARRAA